MTVRQRGSGWQADFMIKGSRFRELFDSEYDAQQWEADVRRAVKAGQPVPEPKGARNVQQVVSKRSASRVHTMEQLRAYTLKHYWEVECKRSIGFWKTNSRQVVNFFGPETLVSSINSQMCLEMAAHFREEGDAEQTVNKKLSALSRMLRMAVETLEIIPKKPKLPFTKGHRSGRTRFLKLEEEKLIQQTLLQWGDEELWDLVVVALDTGFRSGELFRIQWADFNSKMTAVTTWDTKNGQPRTVPLTQRARNTLVKIRGGERSKLHSGGPFVHLDRYKIRSRWGRLLSHLEYDDVVFHTLRHTCASRLVQAGVDLRRVQTWMGHKTIQTTLKYAHLAPTDLKVASDVLDKIHGADGGTRTPTPHGAWT